MQITKNVYLAVDPHDPTNVFATELDAGDRDHPNVMSLTDALISGVIDKFASTSVHRTKDAGQADAFVRGVEHIAPVSHRAHVTEDHETGDKVAVVVNPNQLQPGNKLPHINDIRARSERPANLHEKAVARNLRDRGFATVVVNVDDVARRIAPNEEDGDRYEAARNWLPENRENLEQTLGETAMGLLDEHLRAEGRYQPEEDEPADTPIPT